jgi:FkbM family methyltransferase
MNKIKKLLLGPNILLSSRKIIKNLYSSLYQYLILRKPYIELKLRNGETITVSRFFYLPIMYYYYLGYIKDMNKDGIYFKVNDKTFQVPLKEIEFTKFLRMIRSGWLYHNNYWEKNNIKFKHVYLQIYEVFEEENYKFLNVKDKNVLDIGAFVGDSPIYFILKGAKKVYAIEPHPDVYKEMIENIKLNNMEDKIIPINMGINYENNYVSINIVDINYVGGSFFNSNNTGIKVPASKLSDIIDKYNINAQILKMDCEGCEYDIILKDYDTIKEFDEIGFEYHAYNTKIPVSKLLEKLNKDFECKFIEDKSKDIGLVHCIRKK